MSGWRDDALCPEYPRVWFFPRPQDGYRNAREVCGRCPVATACLEEALRLEEIGVEHRAGMYGGMSPDEREREWRARRKTEAA